MFTLFLRSLNDQIFDEFSEYFIQTEARVLILKYEWGIVDNIGW